MYKYQPGNEDCLSWPTKTNTTNYNFAEIYGAKPNKFKVGDKVRFGWFNRALIGKISHIKGYKLYNTEVDGIIYRDIIEDDIHFIEGKDNNMITVKILGGKETDYARAIKASFPISASKFNTGDKIKFSADGSTNWKRGVIYSLNKKVTVSKTGDEKEFKADNLQWFYTIIENGNLKTWNGIKEEAIRVDDTPDYNKYFDFLFKQGITLDRNRYTWKSFSQQTIVSGTRMEDFSFNGFGQYSVGWKADKSETSYYATLCDKNTNKIVKFEGTQVGTDKLPAISEKC